jgi:hypothetical protein
LATTLHVESRLAGESLAPAFKSLCTAGRTGILTVRADQTVRTISLREGRPVFASSNNPDERFNGVLIRHGMVSFTSLMSAVEKMVRESRRLGEILVREKILDAGRVAAALRLQIREILCHALVVCQGRFHFAEQPVPPYDDVAFRMPVNSVIREALRGVAGFHRILDEVGGTGALFVAGERFQEETASASLDPNEIKELPLFHEPKPLAQLCSESRLPDFDTLRLVWILLAIGALSRME